MIRTSYQIWMTSSSPFDLCFCGYYCDVLFPLHLAHHSHNLYRDGLCPHDAYLRDCHVHLDILYHRVVFHRCSLYHHHRFLMPDNCQRELYPLDQTASREICLNLCCRNASNHLSSHQKADGEGKYSSGEVESIVVGIL